MGGSFSYARYLIDWDVGCMVGGCGIRVVVMVFAGENWVFVFCGCLVCLLVSGLVWVFRFFCVSVVGVL